MSRPFIVLATVQMLNPVEDSHPLDTAGLVAYYDHGQENLRYFNRGIYESNKRTTLDRLVDSGAFPLDFDVFGYLERYVTIPLQTSSLWSTAYLMRRFTDTYTTVIPKPISTIEGLQATLTHLLPELVANEGKIQRTKFFGQALCDITRRLKDEATASSSIKCGASAIEYFFPMNDEEVNSITYYGDIAAKRKDLALIDEAIRAYTLAHSN